MRTFSISARIRFLLSGLFILLSSLPAAKAETIDLTKPPPAPIADTFKMGGKNPAGDEINVNSQYLTLNGKPWTPVMGEFHYFRYPRAAWDEELKKMKAGGITVVSTYVVWIFHQETEGPFDWSGDKDLHAFIKACADNGLLVSLRIGPWVHSEARNGGIPDWVVQQCGRGVRSNDPKFIALTTTLYQQIFAQVKGLLYKDGGPIFSVQIDNESRDIPYLQHLKQLAIDTGFVVPLYTITAWDHVRPPESGLLPMFGGYADGFWYDDKGIPAKGRSHYFFTPIRDDSEIQLATLTPARNSPDLSYINKYPFLTCEIGGGMAISYARRPLMSWQDVTASAFTQFGAGSNLLGYYMYHGGAHPLGKNGNGLQEQQNSPDTNYNDMPPIDYDFQAPLGQYGQVRPSYHALNLLHTFLADFGPQLATMPAAWPDEMPKGVDDLKTLRWTVRTDGKSGFIFINNYERGRSLPARPAALTLKLPAGELAIPAANSMTIPADTFAILPFNFDLNGTLLKYATAQLVCKVDDAGTPVYVFFTPGEMKPEFAFDPATFATPPMPISIGPDGLVHIFPITGGGEMLGGTAKSGTPFKLFVLTQDQAMHLTKANFAGADHLIISNADVCFDKDTLLLTFRNPADMSLSVFPPIPGGLTLNGQPVSSVRKGIFTKYTASLPAKTISLSIKKIKDAAPARSIVFGPSRKPPSPTEPTDADFDNAAVWQVSIPKDALNGLHELYLSADYTGDVARAYIANAFIDDNFYFGQPWEIGIKRFSPNIQDAGLTIKILPLRKDLPIYLEPTKRPQFNDKGEALDLRSLTAIPEYQVHLQVAK